MKYSIFLNIVALTVQNPPCLQGLGLQLRVDASALVSYPGTGNEQSGPANCGRQRQTWLAPAVRVGTQVPPFLQGAEAQSVFCSDTSHLQSNNMEIN